MVPLTKGVKIMNKRLYILKKIKERVISSSGVPSEKLIKDIKEEENK